MANEKEIQGYNADVNLDGNRDDALNQGSIAATQKSRWERSWPVIACGSGLFSDGFSQSVIGPVNTILKQLYKVEYTASRAQQNVSSIAFAGTVLGQLVSHFSYPSPFLSYMANKNLRLVSGIWLYQ